MLYSGDKVFVGNKVSELNFHSYHQWGTQYSHRYPVSLTDQEIHAQITVLTNIVFRPYLLFPIGV